MSLRALVQEYMTTAPLLIRQDEPVGSLVGQLTQHKVSGAPVVDERNRLVGVISVTDLIEYEVNGPRGRHDFMPEEDCMFSALDPRLLRERTAADLMSRPARTVGADERITAAARKMVQFGIHRLIVTGVSDVVDGVLSTLDITRAVAASNAKTPVGRIMSRRAPVWVRPDEDSREALRRLQSSGVTALLVLDGGKPVGFVSQAELVSSLESPDPVPVSSIASPKLLGIEPRTPLNEAAAALLREGLRRLVVMENGQPVGIVTSSDVTRAVDPSSGLL